MPRYDLAYLATQANAYYKRVGEWFRDPTSTVATFPVKPPVVHP